MMFLCNNIIKGWYQNKLQFMYSTSFKLNCEDFDESTSIMVFSH